MVETINGAALQDNLKLKQRELKEKVTVLRSKPTHMALIMGNRCNLNCKMCGNKGLLTRMRFKKPSKLSSRTIKDVVSNFPNLSNLTLSGGEPLAYPKEVKQIIQIAEQYPNIDLKLMTNGNLFNSDWVCKFCDIPMTKIGISIDAASEKIYRRIRVGGNFERVLESIKMINDMKFNGKPKLHINFVVMRCNFHEILNFIELAHTNGVPQVVFQVITNQRRSFYNSENLTPVDKYSYKLLKISEKMQELASDYGIELTNRIPPDILEYNTDCFLRYHGITKDELNSDESFHCDRYWRKLDVSPNHYTACVFSIRHKWDPILNRGQLPKDLPLIKDVWNCEKLVKARELILKHRFDKVCKFSCYKYFHYKTKGVIG